MKSVLRVVLLTLTSGLAFAQQNCDRQYVRREIRELINPDGTPNAELQAFFTGFECIIGNGEYDAFVESHVTAASTAHGVAAFLPWHRLFLVSLETAMRECTGNQDITVPYIDAALDSQALERSVVWNFIGGNSNGDCVTEGPLAQVDQNNCVRRQFASGTIPSTEEVQLFQTEPDYDTFRISLEGGYHAAMHTWVGGDMNSMASPKDIFFYMHHSFVDRIYSEWQATNPDRATEYSGAASGGAANADDELNMHRVSKFNNARRVNELFNIADFCYSYSNSVTPVTNNNGSNTNSTVPPLVPPGTTTGSNGTTVTTTPAANNPDSAAIPLARNLLGEVVTLARRSIFGGNEDEEDDDGQGIRTLIRPNNLAGDNANGSLIDSTLVQLGFNYTTFTEWTTKINTTKLEDYVPTAEDLRRFGTPSYTGTPSGEDRENLYNLRDYKKLPDNYIASMNLDAKTVRLIEDISHGYAEYINTKPDYVSFCSLSHHQIQEYRPVTDQEAQVMRNNGQALRQEYLTSRGYSSLREYFQTA